MKDLKYIFIFVALGLGVAFVASGPLRHPAATAPQSGTAPTGAARVYAEGTISLGSGVSAAEAVKRSLFIFVRALPARQGPPVAVQRFTEPGFPMSFSLTNANNMLGADFYEGDISVVARLDADGKAGPKEADDIETTVEIKAGQPRQVQLTLSK